MPVSTGLAVASIGVLSLFCKMAGPGAYVCHYTFFLAGLGYCVAAGAGLLESRKMCLATTISDACHLLAIILFEVA